MTTKQTTIAFWSVTGLFAGFMMFSGALYLSGAAPMRDAIAQLGYPAYLLIILGTAKLLGGPALLQNRLPILREWAYAGFTIDLIGATASHLFAGDAVTVAMVPALFLGLLAVSYVLQPGRDLVRGRALGQTAAVTA